LFTSGAARPPASPFPFRLLDRRTYIPVIIADDDAIFHSSIRVSDPVRSLGDLMTITLTLFALHSIHCNLYIIDDVGLFVEKSVLKNFGILQ